LTCDVPNLTNQSYTFKVIAHNANGNGPASDASDPITVTTVPGKPSAPSASAGNTTADVTWSEPATGGAVIDSYTVVSSPATTTCTWTTGPLSCHFTGMTNGQQYTFTVTAHNANGNGDTSDPSNSVTPSGVPDKPSPPSAVAGNTVADVTWSAPGNGGSTIDGYTVVSSPATTTCTWSTGPLSCHFTGLTNGQPYTFTVRAHNTNGNGPISDPSNSVTPSTVPDKPSPPSPVAGNAVVDVTWSAPSSGGANIDSYTVVSSPATTTCTWTTGPLSCHFAGMTNGTSYTFTVTAHNTNGSSTTSDPSISVTPSTVPDPPLAPVAVAGNTVVDVTWTAPANGGAAIDSYTVTSTPPTTTCTTGLLTCQFTGMTNGQAYTFSVTAHNINGNSSPSAASVAVTPAAVPDKVTGVSAIRGNGQATIHWTIPNNNGNPITGFSVTDGSGHTCSGGQPT
jgi:hypothetical protein